MTDAGPLALDLGDGRVVRADRPPREVVSALQRLDMAREAGVRPDPPRLRRDVQLVMRWLDEQEAKYPTEGA